MPVGTKSHHIEHSNDESEQAHGNEVTLNADTDSSSNDEHHDEMASVDIHGHLSINAKERERSELQKQIDEFLSKGGEIQKIGANVSADPPKKPTSNYGSRPI